MKKRGICLLPDACYLSELNVPGKPNRTNLGKCAAIQRFLSTHPNENLAILTPYRNQRALLAVTAKKCGYPQEHDPEVTQAAASRYPQGGHCSGSARSSAGGHPYPDQYYRIECLSKVLTEQKLHFLNRPCRQRRGVTTV